MERAPLNIPNQQEWHMHIPEDASLSEVIAVLNAVGIYFIGTELPPEWAQEPVSKFLRTGPQAQAEDTERACEPPQQQGQDNE